MFILKKGHQPGVYVPLRALFLVIQVLYLLCLYKAQTSGERLQDHGYDLRMKIALLITIYDLCAV